MIHRLLIPLMIVLSSLLANSVMADGPAKEIPELQVLSHYVGEWDVAITSEGSPFTKGKSQTTWLLDGRFLQQTGELLSADDSTVIKVTTLMTYDPERKSYRMWSFFSNGSTSEASGSWDEKNRTMTSTGSQGGMTTTTTARFTEDGVEEWTIVTTNKNKDVVGRFGGTNTRQKK